MYLAPLVNVSRSSAARDLVEKVYAPGTYPLLIVTTTASPVAKNEATP